MNRWKSLLIAVAIAWSFASQPQQCDAGHRQYYSSWTYNPTTTYYYTTYYYQPTVNYNGYNYHYGIYYPSQPRYVYYYNPHKNYYWGRYDLEGKDGKVYSILKEEDRKKNLDDISPDAFPKPDEMPAIPDSTDGTKIEPVKSVPQKDMPPK